MAEPEKKIPRIRKSAPTVRERAAAAQAQANKPERPKRVRKFLSRLKTPLGKLVPHVHIRVPLPDNRFGRGLRRALGWFVPRYFINAWREVRLVTWPGRRETWRLTLAVFIFALVFGSMVYGVDSGLDAIFKKFILK